MTSTTGTNTANDTSGYTPPAKDARIFRHTGKGTVRFNHPKMKPVKCECCKGTGTVYVIEKP